MDIYTFKTLMKGVSMKFAVGFAAPAAAVVVFLVLSCSDPSQISLYTPYPSLLTAEADTTNSISLTWTRSTEEVDQFDRYIVYRSLTEDTATDSTIATCIVIISEQDDTTHTDDDLQWSTPYYYALLTVSYIDGGKAWSNEVSATTPTEP